MTPIVSIITSFLNAERFFQESVDSVLGQTYREWELLLVDDGSTDLSADTALHLAENYPKRIRYFEHPFHANRGQAASRNVGIANARGQYIAFLDADDIWMPEKLERQVSVLEHRPEAAMVYGPLVFWYAWSGDPKDAQRDFICSMGNKHDALIEPPEMLLRQIKHADGLPGTCSVLLRRTIVDAVGGFEESFPNMYEDEVFFSKIALRHPVYLMSESYDRYRQHPDSFCARAILSGEYVQNPKVPNKARGAYLRWLLEYIDRSRLDDGTLTAALIDELAPYAAAGI